MPKSTGLPRRWRFYHGAYRYQVPPGQEHAWDGKKQFTLGRTLAEAYKVWAERVAHLENPTTIDKLIERYEHEVLPKKSPATRISDTKRLPILRQRFGHFPIRGGVKPHHIYEYVSKNQHRLTAAHREIGVLSHVFRMAVNWGLIDTHPWAGEVLFQRELKPQPRERYVEDWEVIEVLSLEPRGGVAMVQAYIRLKLLTGLRQTDLLRLPAKFGDDGIRVEASKTGSRQLYTWTPELEAAVAMALKARPVDIAPWLFCTKAGGCYVNDDNQVTTFARIWNNFMHRCLKETKLTVRFAERDLRAKVASDAESLARAQELLGHADARITKRVYVRKAVPIRPAKGVQ